MCVRPVWHGARLVCAVCGDGKSVLLFFYSFPFRFSFLFAPLFSDMLRHNTYAFLIHAHDSVRRPWDERKDWAAAAATVENGSEINFRRLFARKSWSLFPLPSVPNTSFTLGCRACSTMKMKEISTMLTREGHGLSFPGPGAFLWRSLPSGSR